MWDSYFKKIILILSYLALSGCATTESNSPGQLKEILVQNYMNYLDLSVVSIEDLATVSTKKGFARYKTKGIHKAFAASESGSWGYKHSFKTPQLAIEAALGHCELHNSGFRKEKPCKLVSVDGFWAADLVR